MNRLVTITLALGLAATTALGGTLQRIIPTTSAISRSLMTNETQAGWLSGLGITSGGGTGEIPSFLNMLTNNQSGINLGGTFSGIFVGDGSQLTGVGTTAGGTAFTAPIITSTSAVKFAASAGIMLPDSFYKEMQPTPLLMYGSWYDSMDQAEGGWSANEDWIIGTAQWWSTNGYKDAGWTWIRIDDPWMAASWGPNGELVADPARFPNGISNCVWQIHKAGFKACGYTSFGPNSCYGLPATPEDKVFQHVQQFVDWGFDGLMIDLCNGISGDPDDWNRRKFALFGQAVAATGKRLMLLNNTASYPPPVYAPYQTAMLNIFDTDRWFIDVCNDALNSSGAWASNYFGLCSFLDYYDKQMGWMTRPGCSINFGALYWNNRPSTFRAAHGLYAILGAGLMTSSTYNRRAWHYDTNSYAPPWMDGPGASQVYYQTNREWAAIHQDPAVIPGHLRTSNDWCEVWTRPLGGEKTGTNAVFLVNMATNGTKNITVNWSTLNVPDKTLLLVRDVFAQTNVGVFQTNWTYAMPQTNCGLFIAYPAAKELTAVKRTYTDMSSNTTYTDDPDLVVNLEAGGTYRALIDLQYYCATATPGIKVQIVFPTMADYSSRAVVRYGQSNAAQASVWCVPIWGFELTNPSAELVQAGSKGWYQMEFVFRATASGQLKVQWAQNTSSADLTRMAGGSSIRVERIQ